MKIRLNVVLGGAVYAVISAIAAGVFVVYVTRSPALNIVYGGLAAFGAALLAFHTNSRYRRPRATRREALLASLYAWLLICLFVYAVYPFSSYNNFGIDDAVSLVIFFGVSLPIIILAGEIGYQLAIKKTNRSLKEKPAGGRVAIALPLIIMILVSAYALHSGYKGENAPRRGRVKSALKNLATAQEHYYVDHGKYSVNQSDFQKYGWVIEPDITINIITANTSSWSATARHEPSGVEFSYSSSEGGMQ